MENAVLYFILLLLALVMFINLLVSIGISMVVIKVFELTRNEEERYQVQEEAKLRARGLVDIKTPQIPY